MTKCNSLKGHIVDKKCAHKNYCENYNGSLSNLADDIGAMTHGARSEFFNAMADYLENQYRLDLARGRVRYAEKLKEISTLLKQIKKLEDEAWDICGSRTEIIKK